MVLIAGVALVVVQLLAMSDTWRTVLKRQSTPCNHRDGGFEVQSVV